MPGRKPRTAVGAKFDSCVRKVGRRGVADPQAVCASAMNRAYPGALAAARRKARRNPTAEFEHVERVGRELDALVWIDDVSQGDARGWYLFWVNRPSRHRYAHFSRWTFQRHPSGRWSAIRQVGNASEGVSLQSPTRGPIGNKDDAMRAVGTHGWLILLEMQKRWRELAKTSRATARPRPPADARSPVRFRQSPGSETLYLQHESGAMHALRGKRAIKLRREVHAGRGAAEVEELMTDGYKGFLDDDGTVHDFEDLDAYFARRVLAMPRANPSNAERFRDCVDAENDKPGSRDPAEICAERISPRGNPTTRHVSVKRTGRAPRRTIEVRLLLDATGAGARRLVPGYLLSERAGDVVIFRRVWFRASGVRVLDKTHWAEGRVTSRGFELPDDHAARLSHADLEAIRVYVPMLRAGTRANPCDCRS